MYRQRNGMITGTSKLLFYEFLAFLKHNVDVLSRQPTSLVKPPRNGDTNEISNEKLEEVKSRFTRHIILVRHGQYNLDGVNDEERFLTKLGVQQAESTGVRLKQLSLPYTDMVRSTMTRAQQTGELISNSLPDVSYNI